MIDSPSSPLIKNHVWWDIMLILCAGFVIRLAIALVLQTQLDQSGRFDLIAGDAEGYWELATDISQGREYSLYDPPRRIERMPGFPFMISVSQFLFGDKPLYARIWLAFWGAVTCVLVYILGLTAGNRNIGMASGMIASFLPLHAGYAVLFLSETMFATGMLLTLLCWLKLDHSLGKSGFKAVAGFSCLSGIAIGIAVYMKPSWLLASGGFYLWEFIQHPARSGKILLSGIISLVSLLICLSPWTYRNYQICKHFVPTTLWMGASLYDGLNPQATGKSNMQFVDKDQLFQQHSEYEVDQIYRQRAWEFARNHPQKVLKLAIAKLGLYFKPWASAEEIKSWWGHLVIGFSTIIVLVGGVWGLYLWRPDRTVVFLLLWPCLYFAMLHSIFVSSLRYRLPADYALMIPAGFCLLWIFRIQNRQQQGITNHGG